MVYDAAHDPEFQLLGADPLDTAPMDTTHAFRTAPIVTADALHALGSSVFPQRALYGRILTQCAAGFASRPVIPKVYINTNAPFCALVCGVQGSGKSHSTSVLLESCLMKDPRLGTLPAPLSAIVFHFDTAAGGGLVQPCEAAYLAAVDAERGTDAIPPGVTVLVLPSNLQAMRRVYAGLPSVDVEPLHFSPDDISGERLLAMMKVDENTQMPLYMEAIMSILRSMENNFDYAMFRENLRTQKFNPSQKAMLNLRLGLLDSCLQGGNSQNQVSSHFKQGQLTIIDLSSPFMDGSTACGFFDLILGLFVEADVGVTGKVIVLDEAHKYLSESQTGTSARLTDSLLTVIRQQRHLATRIVISTQEPTVVPSKYLDLCSFVIAHRFSSPKWLKLLAEHVSAADESFDDLFSKIVSLGTGQAILFAPNGVGVRSSGDLTMLIDSSVQASTTQVPAAIGQGYLHVQSRLRITRDGGHSILAVPADAGTRLGRVSARAPSDAAPASLPEGSDALQGATTFISTHPPPQDSAAPNLRASAPTFLSAFTASYSTPSSSFNFQTRVSHSPQLKLPSGFSTSPPSSEVVILAMVDYLEGKRKKQNLLKVSFGHMRKELNKMFPALAATGNTANIIEQAGQRGFVVIVAKKRSFWVMLPSSVPQGSLSAAAPGPWGLRTQEQQVLQPTFERTRESPEFHTLGVATTTSPRASSSTGATGQVITCSSTWLRPLMEHILSVQEIPAEGLSVQSIKNHFEKSHRGLYGGDNGKLKHYKKVVSGAITAGLLIGTKGQPGTAGLVRFGLVPGAQYVL